MKAQAQPASLIVSSDETISGFNIIKTIELILSNETINSQDPLRALELIVSASETILKNQGSRALFRYFLEESVISAPEAMATLGMDQATIYRILKVFLARGLVEPIRTVRIKGHRGPRPRFYGLAGRWTPDHVPPAVLKLESLTDPGMALVVNGGQLILEEYLPRGEVKYSEILDRIKPLAKGYSPGDLADQVVKYVRPRGLTVWR